MIRLTPHNGIPRQVLLMMAVMAGFTVANLYYNQPLLDLICRETGITQVEANLITVVTQIGYALGLLFVVPLADMVSVRRIVVVGMSVASVSAVTIGLAGNVWVLWGASLTLGVSSIMPQLFIPMAALYSQPENKSRNMGYVASGLITGIVSARAVSGYVGDWLGWRWMFFIVAFLMLVGLLVSLRMMPQVTLTFKGTYRQLMQTVGSIFMSHPRIRLYSLRPAMSFASMMSIWSCMAFHLAGPPFHAGSDAVGMLALCGVAGAIAASGAGKYVPRVGIFRMSIIGGCLQLMAWVSAWLFGDTYTGPCRHWGTMPASKQPERFPTTTASSHQPREHHLHDHLLHRWESRHLLLWSRLEHGRMAGRLYRRWLFRFRNPLAFCLRAAIYETTE